MQIKRSGFTTLECVISLFIVSMIVFMITSTMHNNIILLRKNHESRQMLYIAKERIEDERDKIKNGTSVKGYNIQDTFNDFTIKTLVTPVSYHNCYNLKVKVLGNNKEMELKTYVTTKE